MLQSNYEALAHHFSLGIKSLCCMTQYEIYFIPIHSVECQSKWQRRNYSQRFQVFHLPSHHHLRLPPAIVVNNLFAVNVCTSLIILTIDLKRLECLPNTSIATRVQNLVASLAKRGITVTEWGPLLHGRLDVPLVCVVGVSHTVPNEVEVCWYCSNSW